MNALVTELVNNFLPTSVTGVTAMSNRASKSKTKEVIPRYRSNAKLFGPPPLFLGEDAAAYDQLHARFHSAVQPVGVVEEMLVADVVFSAWEVLRGRRLKSTLIRVYQVKALIKFLKNKLDFDLYAQDFAAELADFLEDKVPAGSAEQIADAFVQNDPDASKRVNAILTQSNSRVVVIMDVVQRRKAD